MIISVKCWLLLKDISHALTLLVPGWWQYEIQEIIPNREKKKFNTHMHDLKAFIDNLIIILKKYKIM